MTTTSKALGCAIVLVTLCSTLARAEDVAAKKILIKGHGALQIQVQSKDPGVQLSEADDPSASGASLHLYSLTDDLCVQLPAGSGWRIRGTTWKFKDPATKNAAQIGDARLKVKIKYGVLYYSLYDDGSQGTVNAQVQFGTGTRYCMKCSGNKKDNAEEFFGKECAPAACDPEPSTCNPPGSTTTTLEPPTTTTTTTTTTSTTTTTCLPNGPCGSCGGNGVCTLDQTTLEYACADLSTCTLCQSPVCNGGNECTQERPIHNPFFGPFGACCAVCCADANEPCSTDADCCAGHEYECIGGTCQRPQVCCQFPGSYPCHAGVTPGECTSVGGTAVRGGAVCDASNTCAQPGNATTGNCCSLRPGFYGLERTCIMAGPTECASAAGTPYADQVCLPSGRCETDTSPDCGDSAYPTCGGVCTLGQVCRPVVSAQRSASNCSASVTTGCRCFFEADAEACQLADEPGPCSHSAGGGCPAGQACLESSSTSSACDCFDFCCILPGGRCDSAFPFQFCCSEYPSTICPASGTCP